MSGAASMAAVVLSRVLRESKCFESVVMGVILYF